MKNRYEIVAESADQTRLKIKALRKSMPQNNRTEKDAFDKAERELKDQWWEENKGNFL